MNPRHATAIVIALGLASACAREATPKTSADDDAPEGKAASCEPKVGKKAPQIRATPVKGDATVKIPKGKVVLVDFFATWCKPCEASFPAYQSLYVKYRGNGFEIVAVSVDEPDDREKIPAFMRQHGDVKFPVGWDKGGKIAECWDPKVMPTSYLIDRDGVIRHVHKKFEPGTAREIEEQLKALL